MFNVPIGSGSVDLQLDTSQWNAAVSRALGQLSKFPARHPVAIAPDFAAFNAGMGRAQAQARSLQSQLSRLGRSGVFGGGGGGFGSGLASSLSGRFAMGPGMALGEMLGEGAKAAVATAIDLEKQFGTLGRVADYSAGQMADLKKEIFAIAAARGGTSVSELLEIATTGARGGLGREGPEGLLRFTEGLSRVKSIIPDIGVGQLADDTLRILGVFGLGADRAEGFGSALVALDNDSKATADEILNITKRISGLSSQLGMTLPQAMALAATMRDVGLPVEAGASAFTRLLGMMHTQRGKVAGAIGMDEGDFTRMVEKNPMDAFGAVLKELGAKGGATEKAEFIREELGLKNIRDVALLTQLGAQFGDVGRRAGMASEETGSLKALDAADARRAGETWMELGKLKNQATILADTFGQALLPAIKDAAAGLGGVAGLVRSLAGTGAGGAARAAMRGVMGMGMMPEGAGGDRMRRAAGAGWGRLMETLGLGQSAAADEIDRLTRKNLAPLPAVRPSEPVIPEPPEVTRGERMDDAIRNIFRAPGVRRFAGMLGGMDLATMAGGQGAGGVLTGLMGRGVGNGPMPERQQSRFFDSGADLMRDMQTRILNGDPQKENTQKVEENTKALQELKGPLQKLSESMGKTQSNPLARLARPE